MHIGLWFLTAHLFEGSHSSAVWMHGSTHWRVVLSHIRCLGQFLSYTQPSSVLGGAITGGLIGVCEQRGSGIHFSRGSPMKHCGHEQRDLWRTTRQSAFSPQTSRNEQGSTHFPLVQALSAGHWKSDVQIRSKGEKKRKIQAFLQKLQTWKAVFTVMILLNY